jgi:hypothetical protein
MNQITTCTFFKVEGFFHKWWAFKQMNTGLNSLKSVAGLSFFKLLGSGGKGGFSLKPNFGIYVLFCVWESEKNLLDFFADHIFYKAYKKRSVEQFTVYLNSAESHGSWGGISPFIQGAKLALDRPVLVLTRASIRLKKLWSFWRKVGKVSQSLENYDGLAFSIGVGEWPLIQQATISIWKTQSEMLDYAYKNQKHREVVMLTRKLGWYKEEMFARFVPYKFEGFWDGKDVGNMVNQI